MNLLKTIKSSDIFPETQDDFNLIERQREAARAVVFDIDKNVALLHVKNRNYFKLPGGGIEKGESKEEALKRECLEEIGCNIKIDREIGEIVEYRQKHNMSQKSYCYTANLVGEKGQPDFTDKEIEGGFEIIWLDIDRAIEKVKDSKPLGYSGNFIIVRDLEFLVATKSIIN